MGGAEKKNASFESSQYVFIMKGGEKLKTSEASKIILLEKILPGIGKFFYHIFAATNFQLPFDASLNEIKMYQLERLREIARLAYQTPFYKKRFDEAGVDINKIEKTADLKIIVTRNELEKYKNQMRKKGIKMIFSAYTSGSTGNPVYVDVSPKQFLGMFSCAERYMKITSISREDKILILLPREAPSYIAATIGHSLMNYPFEVADFFNLEDQIQKVKNKQVIFGYITRIIDLIQNSKEADIKNLEIILYSGEPLPKAGEEFIKKKTDAKVHGIYATIEALAPIAVMCKRGNYHLNPELFDIEIDKNGSILLTCLDPNRATILLRYDVDDKGEWVNCSCGITFPSFKLEGKFKHLTSQRIEAAIYSSEAFQLGYISPYFDFEERFENAKRVFTIYLENKKTNNLQEISDEIRSIIIYGNKNDLQPSKPLEVMVTGKMVNIEVKFKKLEPRVKNPRFW
jgi:phenylacetate-coenzyme A ligase PaaK-like adenylate-forming protein